MRDNTLAGALRLRGQDVRLLPLFTPLRTDETDCSEPRVFMGGANVYLQQISRAFGLLPAAVRRLLNGRGLLRWLTAGAANASPDRLGAMTVSILQGPQGRQRAELRTLIDYLRGEFRPDVLSLPNLMFLGLAEPIARELSCRVVCELTGEDLFLDALPESYRRRVDELIAAGARHVSLFVATSEYYADHAATRFALPRERIAVVPPGIVAEDLPPALHAHAGPPTVAYLARLCPEKGLDLLVDTMALVRQRPGLEDARLVAGGYAPPGSQRWLDGLASGDSSPPTALPAERPPSGSQRPAWRPSQAAARRDWIDLIGEVDRAGKAGLLQAADVLCVPTRYPEPKGIYVLEGLAAGVPFVGFDHGAFGELARDTGGMVLVPPLDVPALAAALADLLLDPARRASLASAGRAAIVQRYTAAHMADCFLEVVGRVSASATTKANA